MPPALEEVVAIAAGNSHSLALRRDGTVVAWGAQPGTAVPNKLKGVKAIAAGAYHSLALRNNGTVVGWGGNDQNQATPPQGLTGVISIAAGDVHSLALKSDGTVVAWGTDWYGQLTPPSDLAEVIALAAGGVKSLALKRDGTVVQWGDPYYGEPPSNLSGVVGIAAGGSFGLALKNDGTIVRWGQGWFPNVVRHVAAISAHGGNVLGLSSVPSTPWGLDARLPATNQVALSWEDDSGGAVGFLIERATNNGVSGPEGWFPIATVPAGVTNFTDAAVAADRSYWYRVRGHNECYDSDPSSWITLKIAPPQAPQPPFAWAVATQVELSWYAGVAGATGYRIERALDEWGEPGIFSEIGKVTGTGTSGHFTDTALAPDTTYWYRVFAFNSIGESPGSLPVSITIVPPGKPSPPDLNIGDTNQVIVSWNTSWQNDGFKIERALGFFPGGRQTQWTEIGTVFPSNTYSGFYTNTGVTKGARYLYRLRVFNSSGESLPSEPAAITVSPPSPPTLVGYPMLDQIVLQWNPEYTTRIAGNEIQRASDVGGAPGDWTTLAVREGEDSFYEDRGLALGSTYWYRVRRHNWVGQSDFSVPVSATIILPLAPTHLTGWVGTTNRVNLLWYAGGSDAKGYKIERAPDVAGTPGAWRQIGTVTSNIFYYVNFTDVVNANRTNWYRVRAFNSLGDSAFSTPIAVDIVRPPAPVSLSATPFANRVSLTWGSDYLGDVGGYKIERAVDVQGSPGKWTSIATNIGKARSFYSDSDRAAGATYWYRVRAFNWIGESLPSLATAATISPPMPPVDVSPRLGRSNSVELRWYKHPVDQDGFKIESALDAGGIPGAWAEIATVLATNTSWVYFNDTNVTANTTNWYRVRTFNSVGISGYSEVASVRIVPPDPPYFFRVEPFANSVNLEWSSPSGNDLLGFNLERAPKVANGPVEWTVLATNLLSSHYQDANLATNAAYFYRVRALNWVGASTPSSPGFASVVPPRTPGWLTAGLGASNRVNLYWSAGGPDDQDGFKIERAPDVGGSPGVWTEIGTTNTLARSYTDSGVMNNTTNWYRVRAFNVVGSSPASDPAVISIISPNAPRSLSTSTYRERVTLNWHAGDDRAYGFKVERAADQAGSPGAWTQIAQTKASVSSIPDIDRPPGLSFWYRVQAFNWVGDSPFSEAVSVTIVPPAAPHALTARVGDTNCVELSWYSGHPNDQDGFLIERAEVVDGIPGSWTEIATVEAFNAYDAQFTDTNAMANTTNFYRVRAFNTIGVSDYSEPAGVEIVKPPAPHSLWTSIYADRVTLHWEVDYTGKIGGYRIERAEDMEGIPGHWAPLVTTANDARSYSDFGMGAGTYWYRVRAYNWIGKSGNSDPISGTIVPPTAPFELRGSVGYTNQVRLSWHTSPSPFYPSYGGGFAIERAPDNGGTPDKWMEISRILETNLFPGFPFDVARFTDTNVLANTTNWYRLRGFNAVGFSEYSEPTNVRVVPPTAPLLSASTFANRVNLSWNWSVYPRFGPWQEISGLKIERATEVSGVPGLWSVITVVTNGDSFTDTELTGGETYLYRIVAYNWVGESLPGNPVSVTITAPNPPTSLTSFIGTTNQVNLSWVGGSPWDQDGFIIERAADSEGMAGAWTEIGMLFATNAYYAEFIDTNAMANTTNWYRIRAFNFLGTSSPSVTIQQRIIPPIAVDWLNASAYADGVNLQWARGHYGADEISGYKLERALDADGAPGAWEVIATKERYSVYHTDTGRVADTKYWYRVRAFNWIGESADSPFASVTIVGPAKPIGLSSRVGSTNRINLYWSASSPYDQDGFIVERAPDLTGIVGEWMEIGTVNATNYSYGTYSDTNALAHTTNWYRVRAFNVVGISSPSEPVKVEIIPPPTPVIFSASSAANRINLSWYDESYGYGEIQGYVIERGADPGDWNLLIMMTNGSWHFTDIVEPTAGLTYWYRVRAYNWMGESSNSIPVSVTIVGPVAPSLVQASIGGSNRVDVYCYAGNRNDQDGFLLERLVLGGNSESWTEIATLYATNHSYATFTDTNIVANTTNVYRARAFNVLGISPYSPLGGVMLIPPQPPPWLNASLGGPDRVELWWNDYDAGIQGFKVERAVDAGGDLGSWTQIAVLPGQYSFSHYDTTVTTNHNYWYRVRAYNWTGDSTPSRAAMVAFAPDLLRPQILDVVAVGNDVRITWEAVTGTTNVVEASIMPHGVFTPINASLTVAETNKEVSWLDEGALTNSLPSRFYRIRLLP